jgi:uncharacterized DUF497 family protein
MEFEWNEAKRQTNIRKHGIDFIDAVRVFDGWTLTVVDDRFDYGEVRELSTGILDGVLITTIVHTDRGSRIRLISARPASTRERIRYEAALRSRPDN